MHKRELRMLGINDYRKEGSAYILSLGLSKKEMKKKKIKKNR